MVDFVDESNPLEEMKDFLEENWKGVDNIPVPQILVVNDPNDPRVRAELNRGDLLVIKMDGIETLRQRANFKYYDRIFPILIEVYTKDSRQRLRNLLKIIRSIINDNIHSFPSYQLIRYRGQDEAVEENLNIWRGRFRLQLESNAVYIESFS